MYSASIALYNLAWYKIVYQWKIKCKTEHSHKHKKYNPFPIILFSHGYLTKNYHLCCPDFLPDQLKNKIYWCSWVFSVTCWPPEVLFSSHSNLVQNPSDQKTYCYFSIRCHNSVVFHVNLMNIISIQKYLHLPS